MSEVEATINVNGKHTLEESESPIKAKLLKSENGKNGHVEEKVEVAGEESNTNDVDNTEGEDTTNDGEVQVTGHKKRLVGENENSVDNYDDEDDEGDEDGEDEGEHDDEEGDEDDDDVDPDCEDDEDDDGDDDGDDDDEGEGEEDDE